MGWLTLFPAFLACAAAPAAAPQNPAPPGAVANRAAELELMRPVTETFRGIEGALRREAYREASRCGAELAVKGLALCGMRPTDPEHAELRRWTDVLVGAGQALGELAPGSDKRIYREHLEIVRRSCTGCHLQCRSDTDARGLFPSVGNSVFGRISVTKMDGKPRGHNKDLVVFLDQVAGEWPPPVLQPRMSQRECVFRPAVLPVVRGTKVAFPNDDVVFHNVFSVSKTKPFDLDVYGVGESKSATFDKPGLVKVYCNIHPKMLAHILVLNNPFCAVTQPSGFFALTGVPDGRYRLRVWNEFGGSLDREIELTGDGAVRFDAEVRETRRRLPHRNKHGRHYSGYK